MKITHVSLCGTVTDNLSYQDNLLPKYHKKLGFEVSMVTSKYILNDEGQLTVNERSQYINKDGVKIIRIENMFGTTVNSKFKLYKGLYKVIEQEQPDILFIHGVQFINIADIVKYVKKQPHVKVYVDNHADFSNSARNWLSLNILHKVIWRFFAKMIEPYTTKFYGVLPARVDFLKRVYGLPEEKVELLLMGADDEKVQKARDPLVRKAIRERHGIKEDDFLIVTGGKIDKPKWQTLLLMEAVQKIGTERVKLIVFGSVIDELRGKVESLSDGKKVQYIGWISADEAYEYFASADLVVFPGRHSVFWEQVAGLGVPMIVKYWEGTTHVDVGGNCEFLYNDSVEEIREKIEKLALNKEIYNEMKRKALNAMEKFSYKKIAEESIK
ncbi:glycosyltransferase family 4 protein [Fervidobacterium pennivorans subsp. carthaginiensis]|uniref:glycosyltransferase family 4 protein n=1 Tax=Fervidobacterium pennivorans TaxID=93466 RepID=UPI00355C82CA